MFYSLKNIRNSDFHYSLKEKSYIFLKGLFLYFLSVSIIAMFIMGIDEIIVKNLNYPSIHDLFRKSKSNINNNYNIFLIVLLLPFIEELFFRLILVPSRRNITIFTFLLSLFLCYGGLYPQKIDWFLFLSITISSVTSVIILYFLNKNSKIELFFLNKQKILTIISFVTFGLIHLGNIEKIYWELILFYPVYVLPQISIGYFCSILRLKFGFIWGVLFHSTINLIGSSL